MTLRKLYSVTHRVDGEVYVDVMNEYQVQRLQQTGDILKVVPVDAK